MVTALGIDVRSAFTLVFAIGGVGRGARRRARRVYFGAVDPSAGTSLLIFAFIVVVIGGLGSITGTAVAAVVVGARAAVRELLRVVRARRPLGRAAARRRAARSARAASSGAAGA